MTELARCDDCGGPAFWTMIDGHPYYSCQVGCTGFIQLDLGLDMGRDARYLDRVVSVSALAEAEEALSSVSQQEVRQDLPLFSPGG